MRVAATVGKTGLHLEREVGQRIFIVAPDGTEIVLLLVEARPGRAKFAIDAPLSYHVDREEVRERKRRDGAL